VSIRSGLFALALTLALAGCGTNPVTGKKELQFVSQEQEIQIGQQNYAPSRQSQGGDYILDPELTEYVRGVGAKIAAVSDRKLPYELVLLNDSTPNAWAMPGGKMAVNRGLLYELGSEAELAAVLGHEFVHAAARHGAQSMERGVLLQGAILAVGIGSQNSNYGNLLVGGAQVGAQLLATRYGRGAELEADKYGMIYMKRAGYNPTAAVDLQQTFVRLFEARKQNWVEGLFASHPPSAERVAENNKTADQLGREGEYGREIYKQKIASLMRTRDAYKAHEEGMAALRKGDGSKAQSLAQQAIAGEPREARFHELLGDVELNKKQYSSALAYYDKAIKLQPDYFKPHVHSGIALFELGRKQEAVAFLTRGNELLPTAPGHYFLGVIDEERGDIDKALKHYEVAAGSESEIGKQAVQRYVRIDLPRHPENYVRGGTQVGRDGDLYAVVQNAAPVPLRNIRFRVVRTDGQRMLDQSQVHSIPGAIEPGKTASLRLARGPINSRDQLQQYRVVVESASAVQ
jgi:beta-barrel assembly-enhancing protease